MTRYQMLIDGSQQRGFFFQVYTVILLTPLGPTQRGGEGESDDLWHACRMYLSPFLLLLSYAEEEEDFSAHRKLAINLMTPPRPLSLSVLHGLYVQNQDDDDGGRNKQHVARRGGQQQQQLRQVVASGQRKQPLPQRHKRRKHFRILSPSLSLSLSGCVVVLSCDKRNTSETVGRDPLSRFFSL